MACVCACIHTYVLVQARGITGSDSGVFSIVPPYFLRQGLSLDLEGAALARLADPARSWICLSVSQHGGSRHVLSGLALTQVLEMLAQFLRLVK